MTYPTDQYGKKLQYVGFYGCPVESRVVRIGLSKPILGPDMTRARRLSFHIECPACGENHTTKPLWRRVGKEEKRRAEVIVRIVDGIMPRMKGKRSHAKA